MNSVRLLQNVRTGLRALRILRARRSGYADPSHNFAVHHERKAALDGHDSFEGQNAQSIPSGCQDILKCFGGTLEQCGSSRLFNRYVRAADLGVSIFR